MLFLKTTTLFFILLTPLLVAGDYSNTHTYGGHPKSSLSLKVLKNEGFAVGYSSARENPIWVGYRVFEVSQITKHKRPSKFKTDFRTLAKVKHSDYTHSGYDRGHLAPNYVITTRYGREAQLETFFMSNISPQTPSLNRGIWKNLEEKIYSNYSMNLQEVWIVTGPIFDDQIEKLPSGVEIPDAFYKIIIDEIDGEARALAYIMPQNPNSNLISTYKVSIDSIEVKTGLDFFPDLEDTQEDRLEAKAGLNWGGQPHYPKVMNHNDDTTSTSKPIQAISGTYWYNTKSGVRHNQKCRYFGKGKNGVNTSEAKGRGCKVCGG